MDEHEDWREHFDQTAIDRSLKYDPDLDVQALGLSLLPRIRDGSIRNPTAVWVVAAKEALAKGKFRRSGGDPQQGGNVINPRLDELDELWVDWLAAAARGSSPATIAGLIREAGPRFLGLGLDRIAKRLAREGSGWPVRRPGSPEAQDEDIPF